jgi:hypothetical protein
MRRCIVCGYSKSVVVRCGISWRLGICEVEKWVPRLGYLSMRFHVLEYSFVQGIQGSPTKRITFLIKHDVTALSIDIIKQIKRITFVCTLDSTLFSYVQYPGSSTIQVPDIDPKTADSNTKQFLVYQANREHPLEQNSSLLLILIFIHHRYDHWTP